MADPKSQPKKGVLIIMMPRIPRAGVRLPRAAGVVPRVPRVGGGLAGGAGRMGAGGKAPTTSKRGGTNGKGKK